VELKTNLKGNLNAGQFEKRKKHKGEETAFAVSKMRLK
jgi:hypothetical protein